MVPIRFMKKRFLVLTASVAVSLMLVSGCSSQTEETTAANVQTEVTEENPAGEETQPDMPENPDNVAEDITERIWGTIKEVGDGTILVDGTSETANMGEILLMIDPENTLVLDGVNGFPVELKDIQIGNFEAYLGPAMTMSLPPQTTPYVVIVNIPEDIQAPQYVIAAEELDTSGGAKLLTGKDEAVYTLSRNVQITPYLTKNIVQLEDIKRDSRCLVWMNNNGEVERIVLFAE